MPFGDVGQQLVLVAVVVIQRGLGQTTSVGDVIHRRAEVPTAGEQFGGAKQDGLLLFVVVLSPSARHVSHLLNATAIETLPSNHQTHVARVYPHLHTVLRR